MILIVAGTRPEFIKCLPLVKELKKNNFKYFFVSTGQHIELINSGDFDKCFVINDDPETSRLNSILSQSIRNISRFIIKNSEITSVICQGDTSTALAAALVAYNHKKKIIYLESGLRTYDLENPYPEEANRQIISRIADIHLCPTIHNLTNLESERVGGKKFVVGNTGLDGLVKYLSKCEYENKILITLHRRENHELISVWFYELNKIAINYPDHEFILPIHPNPNVKKYESLLTNIKIVAPLSHDNLLNVLVKCKFVITDSGSIQEECSFLGKKAIVCRKETERPEAIGYTTQLCDRPEELASMVKDFMNDYEVNGEHPCPYGDGFTSKKIVKIFKELNIV